VKEIAIEMTGRDLEQHLVSLGVHAHADELGARSTGEDEGRYRHKHMT
jgi:hypothetical protein